MFACNGFDDVRPALAGKAFLLTMKMQWVFGPLPG
jgi:hypothetical protein